MNKVPKKVTCIFPCFIFGKLKVINLNTSQTKFKHHYIHFAFVNSRWIANNQAIFVETFQGS